MRRNETAGPRPEPERAGPTQATETTLNEEALASVLLFTLRKTQAVILRDFTERFDALDLRPVQLGALLMIHDNPGSRQSDIAAALGILRPNFVTMMEELDRRGLTRRKTSSSDRRSYSLGLTAKGEALVAAASRILDDHEAHVCATLEPAERIRLLADLHRIELALSPRQA